MKESAAHFERSAQFLLRSFDRFLSAACIVLRTDAAMVAIIENDTVRVLATCGVPNDLTVHPQPFASVPYGRYETVVIRDAANRTDIQEFMCPPWMDRIGFFARIPLLIEHVQTAGLLVFGKEPRPDITTADIDFLHSLGRSISSTLDALRGTESTESFLQTNGLTLNALQLWVREAREGVALLTSDLKLVFANKILETLLPFKLPEVTVKNIRQFENPLVQNIIFYLDQVVRTGFSLPPLEISAQPLAPEWPFLQSLVLTASPIRPLGQSETFIVLTLRDVSVRSAFQDHIEQGLPIDTHTHDLTTVEFLVETLVARRRVQSRKDTSYITMRSWRSSIRAHQITALKAIKRHNPKPLAVIAAEEIALDIKTLIGAQAFRGVVPMPCGHSPKDKCLSHAIATELANRLNLPVVNTLSIAKSSGSSHPKANLKRPRMKLAFPVHGPLILVDDVATSGDHMREARELLMNSCGSVFAIAWIGGDAREDSK